MKRALQLLLVLSACVFAQDDALPEPSQRPDAAYRLFRTKNTYTFLRLDTRTGMIWTVQWSIEDGKSFVYGLSDTPVLPYGKKAGRFTLYPTKNIYNFVLLDQEGGRTWQVQWNTEPKNRFVSLIPDAFLPELSPVFGIEPDAAAPPTATAGKRPVKPQFGEPGHEKETWEEFEKRQDRYFESLTEFKAREIIAAERAKEKQLVPAAKKSATAPKK